LLFEKIKSTLSKSLTKQNYNRYIKNLDLDINNSKSESIILRAPNIYIVNYIKRYYLKNISNLFEKETGVRPKIEILTVETEIKKDYMSQIKSEIKKSYISLSPEFNFDSFVVGQSNQFAYNVAKGVCENPGTLYNPMFIYGGVGLGKTHLLQAVGNELNKNLEIIYVSSEQFMNEFTYGIRNKKHLDDFRAKFRECDVLLIDDIQFLAGKDATQEEFFHTFNELTNQKKQICITADIQPKKLPKITERLKSRFESGVIVDIQPPQLETKKEIIRKKCEINSINLDEDVVDFIATNLDSSIREIEGVLTNMNAMTKMMGEDKITLDIAKHSLNYRESEKKDEITLADTMELISKEFNIKPSEISSKSRKPNIVLARRTAIYLARGYTKESTPVIAKYFGLKDHSAVSHSIKAFKKKLKEEKEFASLVKELGIKLEKENVNL
jgi:chromosomal replication initiator protein